MTSLTPQPRLQSLLNAEVVAALVAKLGGTVRLRFRDFSAHRLTVYHDAETDELVLLTIPLDEIANVP